MNNHEYLGKKFRIIHDCSKGFEHGTITTCIDANKGVLGLENTEGKRRSFYFNNSTQRDEVGLVESDVVEEFGGFILPSPKELAEPVQIDVVALMRHLKMSFPAVSKMLQEALFKKGFNWWCNHNKEVKNWWNPQTVESEGLVFTLRPNGDLKHGIGKVGQPLIISEKKEQIVRTSVVFTVPSTPVVAVKGGNYTKQELLKLLEELEAK